MKFIRIILCNLLFLSITSLHGQQDDEFVNKISSLMKKNLSNSFVRLEVIGDKKGFWLKPHKDIKEKLMTIMVWANPYNESEQLGTDLYDNEFKIVKTVKYIHNSGDFFSSGEDTWHGLELEEIKNNNTGEGSKNTETTVATDDVVETDEVVDEL